MSKPFITVTIPQPRRVTAHAEARSVLILQFDNSLERHLAQGIICDARREAPDRLSLFHWLGSAAE